MNRFLINRQFAKVWLSGSVSWVGDFVFDTTVLLWISTVLAKGEPWAPAAASGVLLAVLIPTVVVGPLVGVFVDRWDPRRTMLATDLIRAVLIGLLVILPSLPAGTIPVVGQIIVVYIVVVVNTILSRFFNPARYTIIADIVPENEQPRASGITTATSAAAGIIGPPLAAPLLFTAGVQWALVINALSFVFSYAMIWIVKLPPRTSSPEPEGSEEADGAGAKGKGSGFLQEFMVGVKAVIQSRIVLSLMIVGVIANFGMQVFNALGVFFVVENLHTDAKYFGLQEMAIATGVIVGSLLAARLSSRLGVGRVVWTTMLLAGLIFATYSRMSFFAVALGLMLLLGMMIGAMNSAGMPLIYKGVSRDVLGRVLAIFLPVVQSMGIVGIAIAGWLSSSVLHDFDGSAAGIHFGTYDTIFLASAICMVASGAYAAFGLRGADAEPSGPKEPEQEKPRPEESDRV